MKYRTQAHKDGDIILNEQRYFSFYQEILDAIASIKDEEIIALHQSKYAKTMSLSKAINQLLRERLVEKGWMKEAPIFQEATYKNDKMWKLDFAKGLVSVEVGFNHGEAISWNLIKPVLASERNHVEKAIQTKVGVMICATKELKTAGAFDGAVGEFEKINRYLIPLDRILTVPMMIIGLEAPESFKVVKRKIDRKNIGEIVRF